MRNPMTEDIRFEIEQAAAELEEDNQVHFPSDEAKEEFIEDCIDCVTYDEEFYDGDYTPNYNMTILDMAKLYGYLND